MATIDRRERILSRLLEIFAGLEGIQTAVRNRELLTAKDLPAIYLLDGDEAATLDRANAGRANPPVGRPIGLSNIMVMVPEIYLQLDIVKPHNEETGALLNEWRRKLVKAVLGDEALKTFVSHPQGTIRYVAFLTSFGRGKGNDGMLQVEFEFLYPHILAEL